MKRANFAFSVSEPSSQTKKQ